MDRLLVNPKLALSLLEADVSNAEYWEKFCEQQEGTEYSKCKYYKKIIQTTPSTQKGYPWYPNYPDVGDRFPPRKTHPQEYNDNVIRAYGGFGEATEKEERDLWKGRFERWKKEEELRRREELRKELRKQTLEDTDFSSKF